MAAKSTNLPHTFSKTKKGALNQQESTCMYCGRVFSTRNALYWHLPYCKKRRVLRVFEVEGIVFYVYLNPRKDYMKGLVRMQDEIKDAKKFMGALQFLVFYGVVMPDIVKGGILNETVEAAKKSGRYELLGKTPQQDAIREQLIEELRQAK